MQGVCIVSLSLSKKDPSLQRDGSYRCAALVEHEPRPLLPLEHIEQYNFQYALDLDNGVHSVHTYFRVNQVRVEALRSIPALRWHRFTANGTL